MKDRWSGVVPACLSVAVLASAISSSHQQEGAVLQGNACTIPPSVSLAATIESSELNVLVLEGKCYLACLELEPSNSVIHYIGLGMHTYIQLSLSLSLSLFFYIYDCRGGTKMIHTLLGLMPLCLQTATKEDL